MTSNQTDAPQSLPRKTGDLSRALPTFAKKSFELLGQLSEDPTIRRYKQIKDDLREFVEEPFQRVIRQAVRLLPRLIPDVMETEKRVFSRFVKDDLQQDSVRDYYWGAFFPRGGRQTEDAQLSLWMNFKRLEIGFYIGNYGAKSRQRFQRNCQEYADVLMQLFDPLLVEGSILLGARENFDIDNGSVVVNRKISWRDWLRDPALGDYDASLILPKSQVLKLSEAQLVEQVSMTFQKLFPLVLLAVSDDPLPAIAAYLGEEGVEEIIPYSEYALTQVSVVTGFDETLLAEWLGAIERKKQAILYGPPGTGKTFLAQQLARHLVGGSEGFYDLVQFHPSMTYADFVQGPPMKDCGNDLLLNPQPAGRFVDFCAQARSRRGRCVLILDEIQRADLSLVFGELVYLLEYRDDVIHLADGRRFSIPENVLILGTLSTAGPYGQALDYALRRRFAFLSVAPNYDALRHFHQTHQTGFSVDALIMELEALNQEIGDWRYAIGPGSFMREDLAEQIASIWTTEIEPYLEVYFSTQPQRPVSYFWKQVAGRLL